MGIGVASTSNRLDWDGKDAAAALDLLRQGNFGVWDSKRFAHQCIELGIGVVAVSNDALLTSYLYDPTRKDYDQPTSARFSGYRHCSSRSLGALRRRTRFAECVGSCNFV